MPVTSLWRVKGDVAAVVEYATDEKKTQWEKQDRKTVFETMEQQGGTDGEFYVCDLNAVTDYAMRGNATLWRDDSGITHQLVSGINCDPDTAVDDMRWVKRKFQKTGGTVAYHGYQSFAEGEGPPDLIHRIGVETAQRLWGDRFQVVVTTHVDHANHLHNHFVINTVSFVDGKKYFRSGKDYAAFRSVSDELAYRYGFYIIAEPRKRNARDYTPGRISWRKIVRADVDEAIRQAMTDQHFYSILRAKGYELKLGGQDISVRAPGAQRFLRLERNFGEDYSRSAIRCRIVKQWMAKTAKKPPRRMNYRGGNFQSRQKGKQKLHGLQALYIRYCYLLGVIPPKRKRPSYKVSPALKKDLMRLQQITAQTRLLCRHKIGSTEELSTYREQAAARLSLLMDQRKDLTRQQRLVSTYNDPEQYQANQHQIIAISQQCRLIRRELFLCDSIAEQYREISAKVSEVELNERQRRQREETDIRAPGRYGTGWRYK